VRSRRQLLVLSLATAVAAVPLVVLRGAEVQLTTVALIAGLALLLHRARPSRL